MRAHGACRWPWHRTTLAVTACVLAGGACTANAGKTDAVPPAAVNGWRLEPSLTYDALCYINLATGDPFYERYYPGLAAGLRQRLTPDARDALARLKRRIKDDAGNVLPGYLALYFSGAEHRTLADLRALVDSPAVLRAELLRTDYFSEQGWRLFEESRDDLRVILAFLEGDGFAAHWDAHMRPSAAGRIAELEPELERYDVLEGVQAALGAAAPAGPIRVFMLNYCQPHGIRITGTRFLTDVAWPFEIVVRNAVHEMLHPPYPPHGGGQRRLVEAVEGNAYVMERFRGHDPSFGYNSMEGYVEENVVQAIEQVLTERMEIGAEPGQRWRDADGGMHVLAAALYRQMRDRGFPDGSRDVLAFLTGLADAGFFEGDALERSARGVLDSVEQHGGE